MGKTLSKPTAPRRSLHRLVMMLFRPFLWVLATPYGLWLALKPDIHVSWDAGNAWHCVKLWFGCLRKPAFWLGYATDADYRRAKHHNNSAERRAQQKGNNDE